MFTPIFVTVGPTVVKLSGIAVTLSSGPLWTSHTSDFNLTLTLQQIFHDVEKSVFLYIMTKSNGCLVAESFLPEEMNRFIN